VNIALTQIDPQDSVWQRWVHNAERHPDKAAVIHWSQGASQKTWLWRDLIAAARRCAHWLESQGVAPGEVCALIMRHSPFFYPMYFGISAAGAIPAVLAFPNARLHPDKFRKGLEGMASHSGLDWIVTEEKLAEMIAPILSTPASTIRGVLVADRERPWETGPQIEHLPPAGADRICLLQHSSGTTGLQKPVALSHRAVLTHLDRYSAAIALSATDKVISWLPLYHDMGLIAAFYLPLTYAVTVVQLDAFEWVAAPSLFLQASSVESATLTWLPNFAFNLMADRVREDDLEGCDLSSLRLIVNCSEPIRGESHDRFANRFSEFGIRKEILACSYAMAETTFAVTQTRPGSEPLRLTLDRTKLAAGVAVPALPGPGARECVSSGPVIEGCRVRVVDDDGKDLGDGVVGELLIQSESLFDGYRNHPEKTSEVLRYGWYASGDYGFRWAEEYFVIGRKKDILIVAGKNIYPEDIEDAVAEVDGVIAGRVVAFGIDDPALGTEQVCVVAETTVTEGEAQRRIRDAVIRAAMNLDVTVARVDLVPPRWLIKSSSGKPSRRENRERVLASWSSND
jgi:fatty-acyl-CoA synthase